MRRVAKVLKCTQKWTKIKRNNKDIRKLEKKYRWSSQYDAVVFVRLKRIDSYRFCRRSCECGLRRTNSFIRFDCCEYQQSVWYQRLSYKERFCSRSDGSGFIIDELPFIIIMNDDWFLFLLSLQFDFHQWISRQIDLTKAHLTSYPSRSCTFTFCSDC